VLLLGDIVKALGGSLQGSPQTPIEKLAPLETAGPADLSFLSHPKYQMHLTQSLAACVIVTPQFKELAITRGACIVTDDPYHYFAKLTQFWKKQTTPAGHARIHPSAVVDPEAQIADTAMIGPLCVIERGAKVGAYSQLKS
jgi:UDP-3-O-[3-hydroxymyristoyl] glucosamine N-acyltransferase